MGSYVTGAGFSKPKQKIKVKTGLIGWVRIKLKLDPPHETYQYQDNDTYFNTNSEQIYEELLKNHNEILKQVEGWTALRKK